MSEPAPGTDGDARTLSRGGLLLFLTVFLSFTAVILGVKGLFRLSTEVRHNGFSVERTTIDPDRIETAIPLGRIRPLDDPVPMPGREAREVGRKFLVGPDRVVAVTLGGESRAYPLRILTFHEVIGDTVGGVPIAVIHHPISGLVTVIDRRFDGEILRFGPSGLVLDSHLLIYDRPPGDTLAGQERSSLWSPILGEAVAGPRTGTPLRFLPCEVTTWADWRTRFPEGTIPTPLEDYLKQYRKDPYTAYVGSGKPRYRVDPLPDPEIRPYFTPMMIVSLAGSDRSLAYPIPTLIEASRGPLHTAREDGVTLEFRIVDRERGVVTVRTQPEDALEAVRYVYWFTWSPYAGQ